MHIVIIGAVGLAIAGAMYHEDNKTGAAVMLAVVLILAGISHGWI